MVTESSNQPWTWNDLDHASAAQLLAQYLQGATHAGLEPFGSGDFTLAFKQENQVIRVARHHDAAHALKRESCVLAKIATRLPLPVPQPTYYVFPNCPPFTVHDGIVGEILTREKWESMPTAARDKAASDLAMFLKALHSLPVEIGLTCGLEKINATQFARSLRRKITNTIFGLLDSATQTRLADVLALSSSESSSEHPSVVLHCDIGPGHVLYDPQTGQLTGVIDFGDLVIGDPARDFIYVYEDYGPRILEAVLARYAGSNAALMMPAIRKWYLLEAISWTVEMFVTGHRFEVEHGLAEIRRELSEL